MSESFQPVAVRRPNENRLVFALRCLFDLQLLTIFRFLRPKLRNYQGRVLDVGAGESPWRDLLCDAEYVGIDVEVANDFGMRRRPDIIYYDGSSIPFPDGAFDHVLCVEVLEHVPDPDAFLAEIKRVLRTGGALTLTVPWSARLHHVPHDYSRFTRYGLAARLQRVGFAKIHVEERGNDVAVVANKLLVMTIRLLRPKRRVYMIWSWPLALVVAPTAISFIVAAHVALKWNLGTREDPLGYGVVAEKP